MHIQPIHLSKFTKKELDLFFSIAKRSKKNQAFTFLSAPAPSTHSFGRLLVVASRKYGNAPERNLLKRRLKSIFWEEQLFLKKIDVAIIARSSGKLYDFAQLKESLLQLFAHLR